MVEVTKKEATTELIKRLDLRRPWEINLRSEAGQTFRELQDWLIPSPEKVPELVQEAINKGELDWLKLAADIVEKNLTGEEKNEQLRKIVERSIGKAAELFKLAQTLGEAYPPSDKTVQDLFNNFVEIDSYRFSPWEAVKYFQLKYRDKIERNRKKLPKETLNQLEARLDFLYKIEDAIEERSEAKLLLCLHELDHKEFPEEEGRSLIITIAEEFRNMAKKYLWFVNGIAQRNFSEPEKNELLKNGIVLDHEFAVRWAGLWSKPLWRFTRDLYEAEAIDECSWYVGIEDYCK
jgi:hypothetical protein